MKRYGSHILKITDLTTLGLMLSKPASLFLKDLTISQISNAGVGFKNSELILGGPRNCLKSFLCRSDFFIQGWSNLGEIIVECVGYFGRIFKHSSAVVKITLGVALGVCLKNRIYNVPGLFDIRFSSRKLICIAPDFDIFDHAIKFVTELPVLCFVGIVWFDRKFLYNVFLCLMDCMMPLVIHDFNL